MRRAIPAQWFNLGMHLVSMVFGLFGLIFVLPNTEFIESLSEAGLQVFSWGMQNGGASYMIFGAVAAFLYGKQTIGLKRTLAFCIPAIGLSVSSELLGTSTGFPFGAYSYLSGLGYKIAGLVPFTIPLSWFYMGFSAFLVAATLMRFGTGWGYKIMAIALGALMLTSWDFVLDPAMSQTAFPFWEWHQAGEFYGMPYQNFLGWFGTGSLFMTVASIIWGKNDQPILNRQQILFPTILYAGNFMFAFVLSFSSGFYVPALLGIVVGALPLLVLYCTTPNGELDNQAIESGIAVVALDSPK
ncbi:gamma-carotene 1'-hydroxylase CruF [Pseudanabaena sp. UWO310]|uniref:gamma-carotene 1'-hydroxylase CruF n=1 Tax=Pseudanabaena sp. UWO310 TaxID=2480795 RepID=UPI001157CCAD|nr:carotenoid biosynthesis protein [Pseudanabaena sp. UWO310]TYQ31851.1 carotenoid biosynthesis protein [Pseudanabaena sp. UWO310]